MKIAIYARKSRLSEKGESINNQIDACKNYILHWGNVKESEVEFVVYKDEGFSGGNTDRPEFQRMLSDAKQGKFDKLICYRLDRVSRSVADFSGTYELLNEHGIEFVSVKEQFDTSTPIGRAMLNIAMVFAQLERETIAERIKDNMLALAKTGRWLGGKTPTGYSSKQVHYSGDVNEKKMYILEAVNDELEIIRLIFDKFLEIKSLRGVESYLTIHDVLSPQGSRYTAATIKDILANPVYAAADIDTFTYFSSNESEVCMSKDKFDGTFGLMVYNRTDQSKSKITYKPIEEWVIAVGQHKHVIDGSKWVYVQNILFQNTSKSFYNKEGMNYGILSSLIKCKHCGATMKIKKGKLMADGTQAFAYVCSTKDISRGHKCSVKNIIGQDADRDVLEYLVDLAKDESALDKLLNTNELTIYESLSDGSTKLADAEKAIATCDSKISNLMGQMAQLDSTSTLLPIYMEQLKELDSEKRSLLKDIENMKNNIKQDEMYGINIKMVKKALKDLMLLADSLSVQEQRSIIRAVIEKITWDGENLHIELFGQKVMETL